MIEYKVVRFDRNDVVRGKKEKEFEEMLNGLGADGWILVGFLGALEYVYSDAVFYRGTPR